MPYTHPDMEGRFGPGRGFTLGEGDDTLFTTAGLIA